MPLTDREAPRIKVAKMGVRLGPAARIQDTPERKGRCSEYEADQDGGAEGRDSGGTTTLAAPDSMRDRSCQMLHPTMYVEISGSAMIFRKQILVSPRRWDS